MLSFEWDAKKATSNFRKHGVNFDQASLAFRDLFAVEWIDDSEDYGEERTLLLGLSCGQILAVVYTERGENIRIISARRATKHEREYYFHHNGR